jgi:hypothetical protein
MDLNPEDRKPLPGTTHPGEDPSLRRGRYAVRDVVLAVVGLAFVVGDGLLLWWAWPLIGP